MLVLGIKAQSTAAICQHCLSGGARMAEQYGVRLLGQLPLDIRIREETDAGRPTVVADPDGPVGRAYLETARRTAAQLSIAAASGFSAPSITVEET